MQEQTKEEDDAFDIISERRDLKLEASIGDLIVSQFQADRLRNKLSERAAEKEY